MIGYILIGYFITGLLVVWGCNIWSGYKNSEQSLADKEDDSFIIDDLLLLATIRCASTVCGFLSIH